MAGDEQTTAVVEAGVATGTVEAADMVCADATLRRVLSTYSDAIIIFDAQDRTVFTNEAFHRLFPAMPDPAAIMGRTAAQLLWHAARSDHPPNTCIAHAGRDYVDQRLAERAALTTRATAEVELYGRWYRRAEERTPDGAIITTYTDITALKQAQAAAEQGRALLTAAVEAIPGGFMMMDMDLNYLIHNRRYAQIGGVSLAEIARHRNARDTFRLQARRGDFDDRRLDPARFSRVQIASTPCLATLLRCQALRAAGERPGPEEQEAMVEWQAMLFQPGGRIDGESAEQTGTFRVADTGAIVEYRRSRVPGLGWVSLYTDVTERVRQAEELHRARAAAEAALADLKTAQESLIQAEKLAGLGGLVAGVAHELNTPIGIGFTAASHLKDQLAAFRPKLAEGRLRRSELEVFVAEVDEAATLLVTNTGRAARLVQSFKNVSADQTADERRQFALKPCLEEIILSLGPRWRRPGHTVTLHCPDGIWMESYPGALGQVLTNLIVNACVHGFAEGQAGTMDIAVIPTGPGHLVLTFRDDGRGIRQESLSRIFEPFFTTRRGAGSTGLGLHIVFNLVTRTLRGRIDVWSAEGQGTRFTLRLPRVTPVDGDGSA